MDKNFTILYVDDEQQNLISFKASFRREYKIITATSAAEGLEVLRSQPVQMVISDQRMPEMTGVEFFEKILPEFPTIIRVVLTGYSDVAAIINAINKGQVYRYITKPWDDDEVRVTIENARVFHNLQQSNQRLLEELKGKVEEQERTLKLFMRYVPEPVVQKALANSTDSILEGEVRHVAVLFADIRSFTPLSERIQPKEVVTLLNTYYAAMSEIIRKHNGTVNQFVGDEIFAAFGAPLASAAPEKDAVFCAMEMIEALEELNTRLIEPIEIGIGLHSGEVVAGNLGSEDKLEYSLTGDTVNTGKRVETLTKDHPNIILVSPNVFAHVAELVDVKEWDPVELKGKKDKMAVYQLLKKK